MKKSLHYSSLEVQRGTQATFGVTFRVAGTFCHTQAPWTALSTLLWRESLSGLSRGSAPQPGAMLQQGCRARLCSGHLTSCRGPRGQACPPLGVQACPPPGPGVSPLTAAQAAPGGPGHLSPMLFEPLAAAIKSPPLPSPTLKELDLKLI